MSGPSKPIGGAFDWRDLARRDATEYDRRTNAHRPEGDALIVEVRRLHGHGMTAADIATALRVDLAVIRSALGPAERPTSRKLDPPAGICDSCWRSWRASTPRRSVGYCWHAGLGWRLAGGELRVLAMTRLEYRDSLHLTDPDLRPAGGGSTRGSDGT